MRRCLLEQRDTLDEEGEDLGGFVSEDGDDGVGEVSGRGKEGNGFHS